jgi:hypothetical protein
MQRKDSVQDGFLKTLDFAHFLQGSPNERADFAVELVNSLRLTGFVKLKNYGVSTSEIDEIFDLVYPRSLTGFLVPALMEDYSLVAFSA